MNTYTIQFYINGLLARTVSVRATHDYKAVSKARAQVKAGAFAEAKILKIESL